MFRIGIDIGGTFTDFVIHDTEKNSITKFKILSTPKKPSAAVLQGLKKIGIDQPNIIIHGSTVATNALLERKGARTGLISTQGFKDVIQIGRQNRPNLYDLTIESAPALVPADLRLEVHERVDYQGNVIDELDPNQLEEIIKYFHKKKVESIAICLIFSFLYPQHEKLIAEQLKKSGYFVSISSEILPEFREYERTSTTVVNAYVSPILDRYLSELESSLPNSRIHVMQSNGGMIRLNEARKNGARCILSGPAGGIVGAQNIAQTILGENLDNRVRSEVKIISFDMGGTSTDVSLIDGEPQLSTDASIGGCPIHLPLIDIHTVGAGGGSIAYVDPGGSLRVGPQSAGADPGPACYGKGDFPTVTDANLVLGRLIPDFFLGGEMPIYPKRAVKALSQLGSSLGLTAVQAAQGVIEVVNAQMERALRVISVERGHDPRDFNLFSFGGAGGLHAIDLARHMGIPKVIIPKYASTLSAFGMLTSNVIKDYVKTVMLTGTTSKKDILDKFSQLISQGKLDIKDEGFQTDEIEILCSLDLRYAGQSFELNVPYSEEFISDFHQVHQLSYGYSYFDKAVEIVNLRVRAVGKVAPIKLTPVMLNHNLNNLSPIKYTQVNMPGGNTTVPVIDYQQLYPGFLLAGPALIVSSDTTILIYKDDIARVDSYQNLLIEVCSVNPS
jgi:N-methylhydantoinase A